MASQQGWAISQVEALIGLSRRDIQRCCYEGKGGVGILSPEDSKWGRRTYTADVVLVVIAAVAFIAAKHLKQTDTAPTTSESEEIADEE